MNVTSRCCTSVTTVLFCALTACTPAGFGTQPYSFSGTPQLQGSLPLHSAPAVARSWIAPEVRHANEQLVYVAETIANRVVIYEQRGHYQMPVGAISTDITFPVAVWVDTHRNLWVANTNSELESTILRFPQGSKKPDLILNDANWNVLAVWVALDGTVYVVNADYSGNCEIVKYPPGKTTSIVIGDKRLAYLTTAVVGDGKGDLFASGFGQSGVGEVDERPAKSKRWQNTGIKLNEPGGLAFDRAGNLVVSDIGSDVIETFSPGKTTPTNTIACSSQCTSLAFNHAGDRVWVDEAGDESAIIDERTYPSGTLIDRLLPPQGSSPEGVAVTPDLYP
jgi:sugar lactone lactonase YvrE